MGSNTTNINRPQVGDNKDASTMSTEALIMSLLGQIQSLEEERDNARLLAARMRERLEHITEHKKEVTGSRESTGSLNVTTHDGVNPRLARMLREVSSDMVNDLQKIVLNEEQRLYNIKQLGCCVTDKAESRSDSQTFQSQLALYKDHYERLLEEAENEKQVLRKKLKEKQDLVLDRDIKIKEMETKLNNNSTA